MSLFVAGAMFGNAVGLAAYLAWEKAVDWTDRWLRRRAKRRAFPRARVVP